jgi:hypothetical protein
MRHLILGALSVLCLSATARVAQRAYLDPSGRTEMIEARDGKRLATEVAYVVAALGRAGVALDPPHQQNSRP